MNELDKLEKKLEELKKKREELLKKKEMEKKKKEIEGMSYKDFMIKCMKEKGGGTVGMKLCSKEWKKLKGEEEVQVRPEEIGKFIIIGHKLCSACQFLKEAFNDEIKRGEIIYVDAESKEGKKYDEMFDIKEYPFIVYRTNETVEVDGEPQPVYKRCEVKVEGDNITIQTLDESEKV